MNGLKYEGSLEQGCYKERRVTLLYFTPEQFPEFGILFSYYAPASCGVAPEYGFETLEHSAERHSTNERSCATDIPPILHYANIPASRIGKRSN